MDMPVPIFCQDKVYNQIEIKNPSPGVIADTTKLSDDGNYYSALQVFIAGCTVSLTDTDDNVISDKQRIKNIIGYMPFKTADYASIQMMLGYDDEDGIEGVYPCPRCGKEIITEKKDDIDTRDFIGDLKVEYMRDNYENEFRIDMSEPVEITAGKEVVERIEFIFMRHPTLRDCTKANIRYGIKDQVRLQLAIYVEAITKINDIEIDGKWRNRYGMTFLENLKNFRKDLKGIGETIGKYGMSTTVDKTCRHCGKEWKAPINTANFFVSGLRQV